MNTDQDPPSSQTAPHELIAAVRAIENKSTGGFAKFLVLAVSLAVFVAAGMAWWDPKMIGLLVVVLLFHEAGHYVAMRVFGYRNVKMFFIPFLGAAVSGQHFNISGWKKAIVYLAGPIPGIVLSFPLMVVSSKLGLNWMFELGVMSLLLNLLNLLPIMPLDGGWITHLTVLSRSPTLELVARLIGIGVIILFAAISGGHFLLLVAIPLLISLPTTFRVSKVIEGMRDPPLPQPNRDEIPDAAIAQIGDKIASTSLSSVPMPQRATLVVQIYEALIVRPPGLIATLAIWFVYLGTFTMAIVGGAVMYATQDRWSDEWIEDEMFQSTEHSVSLDAHVMDFHLGSESIEKSLLAVARFSSSDELSTYVDQLNDSDTDRFTHLRVGNVLLATVPKPIRPPRRVTSDGDAFENDESMFRDRMRLMFQPIQPETTWLAPLSPAKNRDSGEQVEPAGHSNLTPPFNPAPRSGQQLIHVISGIHHDSIQLTCKAPSVEVATQIANDVFQMPGLTAKKLYVPQWSPIDPPTMNQIANRNLLKRLVDGITKERSPRLWEAREKLIQSQHEHVPTNTLSHQQMLTKFQSTTREIEAEYTAEVIATLSGEQAEVAKTYARYQAAVNQAAVNQAAQSDHATFDQYLDNEANYLGFADSAKPSFHYAAHVSGMVKKQSDTLTLFIHRATDKAATVAALIEYLRNFQFQEFRLHYTTPVAELE